MTSSMHRGETTLETHLELGVELEEERKKSGWGRGGSAGTNIMAGSGPRNEATGPVSLRAVLKPR